MGFKKLREEMSDAAISLEYVMRGHHWIGIDELADVCQSRREIIEFTLEQMICFEMVHRDKWGKYSLTPAYRKFPSAA